MADCIQGHPDGKKALQSIVSSGRVGGVTTNLTLIPPSSVSRFRAQSDLPMFDSVLDKEFEDETRYNHAVAFARMPLRDFITVQANMIGLDPSDFMTDRDAHFSEKHASNKLSEPYSKGNLPTPVLEFSANGQLKQHQEGRHRAYLEKQHGHESIEVMLAVTVK